MRSLHSNVHLHPAGFVAVHFAHLEQTSRNGRPCEHRSGAAIPDAAQALEDADLNSTARILGCFDRNPTLRGILYQGQLEDESKGTFRPSLDAFMVAR